MIMFKETQYIQAGSVNPNALSITKTGRINLNRHFVKRYGLHKNMRAKLYWDEPENKIAFMLTGKDHPGFPLVFVPNGLAAYIIAIQHFRAHKLDPEKYASSYSFEVTDLDQLGLTGGEGEVFVIDLKKPLN